MPRYYCDYCDTYLTHDSPSVRKQHNAGYKHKANVRTYYQQFEEQQTQSLIDQRIKEHLGQAAAFQSQVGATFNPHLMQGPRLSMIRPPVLPVGASAQAPMGSPLLAGVRPPVLPRPVAGPQGYVGMPSLPPTMAPPGASSMPMQMSALSRPLMLAPPATGGISMPMSNGAVPLVNPVTYQANPSSAPSAPAAPPMLQDGFSYAQPSEIGR